MSKGIPGVCAGRIFVKGFATAYHAHAVGRLRRVKEQDEHVAQQHRLRLDGGRLELGVGRAPRLDGTEAAPLRLVPCDEMGVGRRVQALLAGALFELVAQTQHLCRRVRRLGRRQAHLVHVIGEVEQPRRVGGQRGLLQPALGEKGEVGFDPRAKPWGAKDGSERGFDPLGRLQPPEEAQRIGPVVGHRQLEAGAPLAPPIDGGGAMLLVRLKVCPQLVAHRRERVAFRVRLLLVGLVLQQLGGERRALLLFRLCGLHRHCRRRGQRRRLFLLLRRPWARGAKGGEQRHRLERRAVGTHRHPRRFEGHQRHVAHASVQFAHEPLQVRKLAARHEPLLDVARAQRQHLGLHVGAMQQPVQRPRRPLVAVEPTLEVGLEDPPPIGGRVASPIAQLDGAEGLVLARERARGARSAGLVKGAHGEHLPHRLGAVRGFPSSHLSAHSAGRGPRRIRVASPASPCAPRASR